MLNVEGIAFRFLPDPVQIKNALEVCCLLLFFPDLSCKCVILSAPHQSTEVAKFSP